MKLVMIDDGGKFTVIESNMISTTKNRIGLSKERKLDFYNHLWHFSQNGKLLGKYKEWELLAE